MGLFESARLLERPLSKSTKRQTDREVTAQSYGSHEDRQAAEGKPEREGYVMSLRSRARAQGQFSPRSVAVLFTLLGLLLTLPGTSIADGGGEAVVRVEEDWELVLNEPDFDINCPQFHTVMSPFGNLGNFYAQVTWNYREQPGYTSGGVQMQGWSGENLLLTKSFRSDEMSTVAETVNWTQTLETNGEWLKFRIENGVSTTWGDFGGDVMTIADAANLDNLNGYSSSVSTGNSWITYGSNRVNLLVLREVRRYGASGLLSVDIQPKVVFQFSN
jgi:hypothetical protein